MSVAAIIPARLSSSRFPNKVIYPFFGLPMLEHVRRRTILANVVDEVYVATCDKKIEALVLSYGGKVILTSKKHENGTSRIAEACKQIDCTHIMLVQGDEPLLLPSHLHLMKDALNLYPEVEAWNITGPIESSEDLNKHSFVKCAVNSVGKIMYCFRKSPAFSNFDIQIQYVRKMLGLISYRKEFLLKFMELDKGLVEVSESIEQMRIIEQGHVLNSVFVDKSLPSVNEKIDIKIVNNYLNTDQEQKKWLKEVLSFQY
jgi:3-deoxy-manno-octulosonate cytidylyltransferase (CMP-KDO synthetase)